MISSRGVVTKADYSLAGSAELVLNEKRRLNMPDVELRANFEPKPKKWTPLETKLLLRLWKQYQLGALTAGQLRGQLQSRTMSAINKKLWTILGKQGKGKRENIDQRKFDFYQNKITCKS